MLLSKHNITAAQLAVYAVTDRKWLQKEQTLAQQVEQAILGGATIVQLREKHVTAQAFLALAQEVKQVTDRYQIPLIIDDAVDVALAVGAAGVHVGQQDMEAVEARRRLGTDKIMGVSAQTVEQALAAQRAGADYLGVGAVFPTNSKADAVAVSLDTLRAICAAVQIPVVAIGGINAENMIALQGTGIVGVAVISAIFAKPDVRQAAAQLTQQWNAMRKQEWKLI